LEIFLNFLGGKIVGENFVFFGDKSEFFEKDFN